VLRADGSPLSNSPVTVEQVSHAFGFGNIGFDFVGLVGGGTSGVDSTFGGASSESAATLADQWLDLFNFATLPFYWRGFEPIQGEPDTDRLMATALWFREHGVTVKGHPLLWHTLAPTWLMGMDMAQLEATIRARITREASQFAGVIDLWDAINEVCILPRFTAEENAVTQLAQIKGRVEMVRMAVDTARAANPNARLVLNDFILTAEYEHLIEECLAAGIQLDAIGVQTHMHQGFRGEDDIADILQRFGRFGLPVQMTETTLVSGEIMPAHIVDLNDYQVESWPSTPEGEARQADEIERHYRTCLAHPMVESIVYWGFADEGAWLGAPSGFIRLDGTPKPAYDTLKRLVKKDWWVSPTTLHTDADGWVTLSGWAGEYRVTAGDVESRVDIR
jgi:GH35 family endo-1,4-beta-xylanase